MPPLPKGFLEGIRAGKTNKSNRNPPPKTVVVDTEVVTLGDQIKVLEEQMKSKSLCVDKDSAGAEAACRMKYKNQLAELKKTFDDNELFRTHNVMDLPQQILDHFKTKCGTYSDTTMRYMGRWDPKTVEPSGDTEGMFYIIEGTDGDWLIRSSDKTWKRVAEKSLLKTPWGKDVDLDLEKIRKLLVTRISQGQSDAGMLFSTIVQTLGESGCTDHGGKRTAVLAAVDDDVRRLKQTKAQENEKQSLVADTKDSSTFFRRFGGVFAQAKGFRRTKLSANYSVSEASRFAFTMFQDAVIMQLRRMYPNLDNDTIEETYTTHILGPQQDVLQTAFPGFDKIRVVMTLDDARVEIARLTTLVADDDAVPGKCADLQALQDKYDTLQETCEKTTDYDQLLDQYATRQQEKDKLQSISTKIRSLDTRHESRALEDLAVRFYNQIIDFRQHWVLRQNISIWDQVIKQRDDGKVLVMRPSYRDGRHKVHPLTEEKKNRIHAYLKSFTSEIQGMTS
tara:strand:+ start:1668 stop:3188 length:1521 start_codon:yes stop_codon:yes gene_type:complete